MADQVVKTIFQFLNDKQSTNQVLRDNARIDDSLEAIDDSADKVTDAYSDMERAAKRTAKANQDVSEASIRSAKQQSELVGDVASRTSQLSGAAAGLGAIGGQRLMIAADILDAAEAAVLLRAEFPAMISQMVAMKGQLLLMGAAGGALALGILATKLYNEEKQREKKRLEESRQALKEYVDSLVELNTFLVDATQKEVQARIDSAEVELKGVLDTRQEIASAIAEQQEIIANAAKEAGLTETEVNDIVTGMSDVSDGMRVLGDEAFDPELVTTIKDAAGEILLLDEQLKSLGEQSETFEKDIERLEGNLVTASQGVTLLDEAVFSAGSSARLMFNVFNDMVDVAIPLSAEMDAYNKILEEQEADALAAAAALFNLDEELENVGTSFETIEAGAKAIAKAEEDRIKVIADTEQAILDVTVEGAAKRQELIANTERQITDLRADFDQDAADDVRDHRETINEITRDFQQENLKDLQDFQRDQRRAEEDHRDNILDAAGRLDAVGILNEQRSFEKDQKRAKEDFDTEQKRRAKEFKTRLKDEDKAFKKQRQLAECSYRERERDLRDSLNRQLADSRTAQNREIINLRGHQAQRLAEIDNALDTELRALTGFTEDEEGVRGDHYVAMLDQLNTFVDDANATLAGLGGGGAVGAPITTPFPGGVGQFPASAGALMPSGGFTSPFASPAAMMAPVSRGMSTTNNMPQVTNNFSGMDRLSPGQIRNVVKIINNEILGATA